MYYLRSEAVKAFQYYSHSTSVLTILITTVIALIVSNNYDFMFTSMYLQETFQSCNSAMY